MTRMGPVGYEWSRVHISPTLADRLNDSISIVSIPFTEEINRALRLTHDFLFLFSKLLASVPYLYFFFHYSFLMALFFYLILVLYLLYYPIILITKNICDLVISVH